MDRLGWVATGMRRWKHRPLQRVFGKHGRVDFVMEGARAVQRARRDKKPVMVWASKMAPNLPALCETAGVPLWQVEDAALRSRGLGATLVPALGLVLDDIGVAFDATRPSRFERCVEDASKLPPTALKRASKLMDIIRSAGLTKYNIGAAQPEPVTSDKPRVLVVGQVEDDGSVLKGMAAVRTNLGLLNVVRDACPEAHLIYKPHPDVEAGLRRGKVPEDRLKVLADTVWDGVDPAAALGAVDTVWTITSTLGFEALIRGVPVTCLGMPFYAGWGLTEDRGPVAERRTARPSLAALAHAALIDYPRYFDPVTGLPCPPEVILDRLMDVSMKARPGLPVPILSGLRRLLRPR